MDLRHSILIYHLPEAYQEDAVTIISKLTAITEESISLMKPDYWGSKLILGNELNFRKVMSLNVLHVHNKAYPLYSLVTDLIVCGKGNQIDAMKVQLILQKFAPVLIVYDVSNQHGAMTFRAALNYPEIPEIVQLWTGNKLKISGYDNIEFSISLFCRFCRQNGHFKSHCLKRHTPFVKEAVASPSALKNDGIVNHEKKESKPQSVDQRHGNMKNLQNFSHIPLPSQSQVQPYRHPLTSQTSKYPQCHTSSRISSSPLPPYKHATSISPSFPSCEFGDKQKKTVVLSKNKDGAEKITKESSDCRAGFRNEYDKKKIPAFEASSSKPLSPSTNLIHLIPPSMQNEIETLKLFFSHCKNLKHLYKTALRYPAGIGVLLRQLRKIVKFNKNIKTKSEEEMKFIAWICLLSSRLQYLHFKKIIQLEPFYEPLL